MRMTEITYPGMRADASDTGCLRGLSKLSILMRLFVEMREFSSSRCALTLCIKKSQGGGGEINMWTLTYLNSTTSFLIFKKEIYDF